MQRSALKDQALVWYVSYGSNMFASRLAIYLQGGAITGNDRHYGPADDPRLPTVVTAVTLPHQLYFAGTSVAWTGGVAFINPDAAGTTLARAYLVTLAQLRHVITQENWHASPIHLPSQKAMAQGSALLSDVTGRYDELLFLGERDNHPMFTMTSSQHEQLPTRPAEAYVATIASGLAEMGYKPSKIRTYLLSLPGITGNYTEADLVKLQSRSQAVSIDL